MATCWRAADAGDSPPAPKRPETVTETTAALEDEAQEAYVDALDVLDDGNRGLAIRMMRIVAARYPSTAAAEKARRQVAELELAAAATPTPAVGAAARSALPTPAAVAPQRAAAPAISSAAIADRFRFEVGDRIFFAADSAELGSRARGALAAQAQWLNAHPEVDVLIEGHADEPGSPEHNKLVSQERAEAVRQRLILEGVAAHRIAVNAFGRSKRVAPCPEADCAAQNRRATTTIVLRGEQRGGVRAEAMPKEAAERSLPAMPASMTVESHTLR